MKKLFVLIMFSFTISINLISQIYVDTIDYEEIELTEFQRQVNEKLSNLKYLTFSDNQHICHGMQFTDIVIGHGYLHVLYGPELEPESFSIISYPTINHLYIELVVSNFDSESSIYGLATVTISSDYSWIKFQNHINNEWIILSRNIPDISSYQLIDKNIIKLENCTTND